MRSIVGVDIRDTGRQFNADPFRYRTCEVGAAHVLVVREVEKTRYRIVLQQAQDHVDNVIPVDAIPWRADFGARYPQSGTNLLFAEPFRAIDPWQSEYRPLGSPTPCCRDQCLFRVEPAERADAK